MAFSKTGVFEYGIFLFVYVDFDREQKPCLSAWLIERLCEKRQVLTLENILRRPEPHQLDVIRGGGEVINDPTGGLSGGYIVER